MPDSKESRIIRPYNGLSPFEDLFSGTQLFVGRFGSADSGSLNVPASDYKNGGIFLRLNKEGDDNFSDEFLKHLVKTGLAKKDIEFLIFATTPFLKITKILWRGNIDELSSIGQDIQLTKAGRADPFRSPKAGCEVTFAAVLQKTLPKKPLTPHRSGTWLAKAHFSITTDDGEIGFTPRPLTAEDRGKLGLHPGVLRYVEVSDVLSSETTEQDVILWADEELLNSALAQQNSHGARAFLHQLSLTAISAIVTSAQQELNSRNGQRIEWDEIQGSLLARIITGGDPKMSQTSKQNYLEMVDQDPNKFIALIEDRISALKPQILSSITVEAN